MKVMKNVELLKKIYDKFLTDIAKKNNLTLIELKILMFLDKNESNFARDIVEGIKATKSHVSMAVCDLEKKGYIQKIKNQNDKKKNHLQLTEKSFNVIEEGNKIQIKIEKIMMEDISREELKILKNISKKIQNNLEKYNSNDY